MSKIAGNAISKEFTRSVYVSYRSKTVLSKKSGILLRNIYFWAFCGSTGTFPTRVSLLSRGKALLYVGDNGALKVIGF